MNIPNFLMEIDIVAGAGIGEIGLLIVLTGVLRPWICEIGLLFEPTGVYRPWICEIELLFESTGVLGA
jgi:hypothetical protein